MYSSSTSSSSQGNSLGPNGGSGLVRYGSAPSSLLSTAVDSLMNPDGGGFSGYGLHMGPSSHAPPSTSRLFFSSSETSSQHAGPKTSDHDNGGLQRAYGFAGSSALPPPPLVRHRSSPAGFLNQLAHAACTSNDENGFSTARARGVSRLNSQMSFTRQEALSLISEESEDDANEKRKSTQSYHSGSYGGPSWEDPHTIMFSMGPSKRPKDISTEMISSLDGMESQIQFGMPETMLEMASMDKLLNIPEDSVACKIRAKRGCATHPRSIAERERRTRISGKLKKLHDLVPNMDKQTSYSDMLDLAVQHIKGLQDHVQKLNRELDNCTCGCRRPNNDSAEGRR